MMCAEQHMVSFVGTRVAQRKGYDMATLGEQIGKVRHTFKTTNDNGDSVTTTQIFDFTTADDESIKNWLCGNRAIARQRPMKTLSADEMKKLDGKTVKAENAGAKIESDEAVIERAKVAFESMTPEQQELYIEFLQAKATNKA